jgi:hypothetical protein
MMWSEFNRRRSRTRALLVLITSVFLAACSSTPTSPAPDGGGHHTSETQSVVFSATGGGTPIAQSITYATLQHGGSPGENGLIKNVPLPWTKTIVETVSPDAITGLWPYYYLDVHNGSGPLTYVTCSISVDGHVVSTDKESGPNAIASCGAPSHASAPVLRFLGPATS